MTTKKTVLLKGPLLTKSGYGVHARQIASWLFGHQDSFDITTQILPWGTTPWILDPNEQIGLTGFCVGQLIQAANNKKQFYDISIQIQLPNEWEPFAAGYNVGVTAGVETTTCNPSWITKINQMDLVIVPSDFTKQTFLDTGKVTTPIHVIGESYPDCFDIGTSKTKLSEKLNDTLETDFNFLAVGLLTGNNPENDRKNIQYLLKWFSETFKGITSKVGLIVKTSAGRLTHLDRTMVHNVLNKTLIENKLVEPGVVGPKFYFLHGDLTDIEMKDLYSHYKVKGLINCSKGEGFGLPVLEAAALGLPVLATNWSGYLDFLNKGKFIKFDYKLDGIHPSRIDGEIFVEGAKWANPIDEDVKKKLVKFYNQPEIPQQWAKELQKTIQSEYSSKSVLKLYDNLLLELFNGVS